MIRSLLTQYGWLLLPIAGISLERWAPKASGVRDPRSSAKKNGMFWSWPRYLYFGGVPGAPMQAGTKGPSLNAADGQNAAAPITDRGKGGRNS